MYKPGTQLIMNELWAAAAAHKLGFVVHSNPNNNEYVIQNDIGWVHMFLPDVRVWRITVTESGPNAAERFLPQVGDLIDHGGSAVTVLPTGETALFVHNEIELDGATVLFERVIERNGIPFPQFSEVIAP